MYMILEAKPKKSVKLSDLERASLRAKIAAHPTMTEAAIQLGVGREVLIRMNVLGSCSETTYNKIFGKND